MFFLDNNTGFITGRYLFIKTTDGGQSWTSLKTNAFDDFYEIIFKNNNEGYVSSQVGAYFKTIDGGVSWNKIKTKWNALFSFCIAENKVLVGTDVETLSDMDDLNLSYPKPNPSQKLLDFNAQKAIGISARIDVDFASHGILYLTNNAWNTYTTKTYTNHEVAWFSASAKMSSNKIMLLGVSSPVAKVFVLKR